MGLNIKNQRVHDLAREAASRTGMSQTSVIEEALRRLLADLPDVRADRARRAREWFDALPPVPEEVQRDARAFEAELFDPVTGLPR